MKTNGRATREGIFWEAVSLGWDSAGREKEGGKSELVWGAKEGETEERKRWDWAVFGERCFSGGGFLSWTEEQIEYRLKEDLEEETWVRGIFSEFTRAEEEHWEGLPGKFTLYCPFSPISYYFLSLLLCLVGICCLDVWIREHIDSSWFMGCIDIAIVVSFPLPWFC